MRIPKYKIVCMHTILGAKFKFNLQASDVNTLPLVVFVKPSFLMINKN